MITKILLAIKLTYRKMQFGHMTPNVSEYIFMLFPFFFEKFLFRFELETITFTVPCNYNHKLKRLCVMIFRFQSFLNKVV